MVPGERLPMPSVLSRARLLYWSDASYLHLASEDSRTLPDRRAYGSLMLPPPVPKVQTRVTADRQCGSACMTGRQVERARKSVGLGRRLSNVRFIWRQE